MKHKALTQIEWQILDFIETCWKKGNVPTNKEIAKQIKAPHISGAQYYVNKLVNAGYLSRNPSLARSLRIINRGWRLSKVSINTKKSNRNKKVKR